MEKIVITTARYVFEHKYTKARLSFESDSDQEAIMTLGKLCQTVMDWRMRKYNISKTRKKKLKKNVEKT